MTDSPAPPTLKGQTILVTEGVGRCQRRREQVGTIRPGDRVFFDPGEHH